MSKSDQIAISEAVEQLALALGQSAAIPRGELVRALERAADRLRAPAPDRQRPTDLMSQAEAARLIGVSRQAVNQWARKGLIRSYEADDAGARRVLVSAAEVTVAANRSRIDPMPDSMQREIPEFLSALERSAAGPLAKELSEVFAAGAKEIPSGPGSAVLRDFLVASMGTEGQRAEFTPDGLQALGGMRPAFEVDPDEPFGRLAGHLGLLVAGGGERPGFDSLYTALLGLVGVATVGSSVEGKGGEIGRVVANAAAEVWGEDWVRRLFDAAFHSAPLALAPVTRLTPSLVYLTCNRFIREAQTTGVSVTHARLPGAMLPQSYYGRPWLEGHLIDEEVPTEDWRVSSSSLASPAESPSSTSSPFRVFNFEYGLFDDSIRGIRRCLYAGDVFDGFGAHFASLPEDVRDRYAKLVTAAQARILSKSYVELAVIEPPGDFDWWRDHTIRSSASETVIALRSNHARSLAHALAVRTNVIPEVVEGETDADLRERLRIHAKNLDFAVAEERYLYDLTQENIRVVKSASSVLKSREAEEFAAQHVRRLLAAR